MKGPGQMSPYWEFGEGKEKDRDRRKLKFGWSKCKMKDRP